MSIEEALAALQIEHLELLDLPDDILRHIFLLSCSLSPNTFFNLRLVCRAFKDLSTSMLSQLTFHFVVDDIAEPSLLVDPAAMTLKLTSPNTDIVRRLGRALTRVLDMGIDTSLLRLSFAGEHVANDHLGTWLPYLIYDAPFASLDLRLKSFPSEIRDLFYFCTHMARRPTEPWSKLAFLAFDCYDLITGLPDRLRASEIASLAFLPALEELSDVRVANLDAATFAEWRSLASLKRLHVNVRGPATWLSQFRNLETLRIGIFSHENLADAVRTIERMASLRSLDVATDSVLTASSRSLFPLRFDMSNLSALTNLRLSGALFHTSALSLPPSIVKLNLRLLRQSPNPALRDDSPSPSQAPGTGGGTTTAATCREEVVVRAQIPSSSEVEWSSEGLRAHFPSLASVEIRFMM